MTTTNTSRIDIENIRNCCGPPVTISRTMPAILGGHMREYEWTQFCDKVNEVLEPITYLKRKAQLSMLLLGLVDVAISLVFIFLFVVKDSGDTYGGPNFTFFIIPIVGFAITFAVFWTLAIIWNRQSQTIQEELSKVCHEQSSKDPMVSFHVRKETHYTGSGDSRSTYETVYLEVQVSPNASSSYAPSAPYYEGSIPTATPVFGGESKSVEMRLEDLERLKPQLSEEEYQRKRDDILSMV